ncbi:MAG TPA: diacylglycerol kinase [Caldilineaceae bacterium]|nr:diacylglycerol kinase [Caldilineaceae bacterium]
MPTSTTSRWKRFDPSDKVRVFVTGLRMAAAHDRNVAIQMAISLIVCAVALWLQQWFDVILIVLATGNVLVFEILNTVVEAICDYVEPHYDPRIGAIKDMAAAATGIAILIWLVIILYEVLRIWALWS